MALDNLASAVIVRWRSGPWLGFIPQAEDRAVLLAPLWSFVESRKPDAWRGRTGPNSRGIEPQSSRLNVFSRMIVTKQSQASPKCVGVVAQTHVAWQFFHVLGIPTPQHHVVDHQRGL